MSPGQLQQRLRTVTEGLAAALHGDARAPDWDDVDWRLARAMAVVHGIGPLLAPRADFGPPPWQSFVADQRRQVALRHARLEALLDAIHQDAADAGIAFVPLKGVALHALGLYVPGERPMADLDLLVRPEQVTPLAGLCAARGYRVVSVGDDVHVLIPGPPAASTPFAEHADGAIAIELHTRVAQPLPVRRIDLTAALWPARPEPGRNTYRSLAALAAHLVMHAAVNMQLRVLRNLQLVDFARLGPHLQSADWEGLLDVAACSGRPSWVYPPLVLLERYAPGVVPAGALDDARAACPRWLRIVADRLTLTDVSVSNLHRSPVHGLAWSSGPREFRQCLALRLGRGLGAVRAGGADRSVSLERTPWETATRRRRAVDLLFRRPRPETLYMVEAALRGEY